MAQPTVGTYNTNGKVVTGRTAMNGDYVSASVRAKAIGWELCAGWAQYSGLKTFEIKPILTWAEYPTGIVDVPLDASGNPTSAADANIYASYTDNWKYMYNSMIVPLHGIELRYYCSLYYNLNIANGARRHIVWMSEGTGFDTVIIPGNPAIGHPPFGSKYPKSDFDLSASFDLNLDVACKERVEIVQNVGAGSVWLWPADCFHDGMGTTHATFDAVGDTAVCSITIGSDSISSDDMPDNFIGSLAYGVFDSSRTIEGKALLVTSQVGYFGWGSLNEYTSQYKFTNQAIFSSITQVAQMALGTREHDLRFRSGQTYTGTDTNCEGVASDNSFEFKAINSPASASGAFVGTHAKWTDLGISYKHEVDFQMMDGGGDAGSVTPEFLDVASNTSWTGTQSPVIVYDGVWQLKMYELDGSIMDTRSTETDASGSGASWARSNAAPSYLQVRFTNPEDYNDTAESQYNEQTEQWEDRDDYRCQFVYPREQEVVSIVLDDETVIDEMSSIDVQGVGGWAGVNCAVTTVGGHVFVSNVSAGAYIYRSDFMTDGDIRQPKHWPGYRFSRVYADCFDINNEIAPYDLAMTVRRTGGADTMSKVFTVQESHHPTGGSLIMDLNANSWVARYDTCHPSDAGYTDTTESYIDQALPLATAIVNEERVNAELSNLSWSWGIGAFDQILISGFTAGCTYKFLSLTGVYLDPHVDGLTRTDFGKAIYVQQESNKWRDVGPTAITEYPEDDWDNKVCRHIIATTNGKVAWEAPSVKVSKSPNYVVDNYANYSIQQVFEYENSRWPLDDFGAYSFFPASAFSSSSWDAEAEEYTSEDVLFNSDTCPIWFCKTKSISGGEIDNLNSLTIYASPMYDRVTLYLGYRDGTGTTARTGYATLKLIKRVRCRVNGIAWDGGQTPYDKAGSDDLSASYNVYEYTPDGTLVQTDAYGYYRTGDMFTPATVYFNSELDASIVSAKNRTWYRICADIRSQSANIDILNFGDINELYYADDTNGKHISALGVKLDNTQIYKFTVDQNIVADDLSVQLRKSRYHNENVIRDIVCHNTGTDSLSLISNYGSADSQASWDSTAKVSYTIPNTVGFTRPSIASSAAYNMVYLAAMKDDAIYFMYCHAANITTATNWSTPELIMSGVDTQYISLTFDDRAGRLFLAFYQGSAYQMFVYQNGWTLLTQVTLTNNNYKIIRNFANGQYMGIGPKASNVDATSEYFTTFDATPAVYSSNLVVKDQRMGIVADSDDIKRIAYFDSNGVPKVGYLNLDTTISH